MTWTSGWWSGARKVALHPGRLGGVIFPIGIVVHTTDMLPGAWSGLLASWAGNPGRGNAAHFGIGRDDQAGCVQWAPVSRNANHAGGPSHGVYQVNAAHLHPNLVTIGIEVHNAGGLRLVDDQWRWGEGKPWESKGPAIPPGDVEPDPIRPGRGWHKPTDYQLRMLDSLIKDLEQILQPLPDGAMVKSGGAEKPPTWALTRTPRLVGHVTLDPERRSDPWPLIMRHINSG